MMTVIERKTQINEILHRKDLWPEIQTRLAQEVVVNIVPLPVPWPGPPEARIAALLQVLGEAQPYAAAVPQVQFQVAMKALDALVWNPQISGDDPNRGATKHLPPISAVLLTEEIWGGWFADLGGNDSAATVIHELGHAAEYHTNPILPNEVWWEIWSEFYAEFFAAALRPGFKLLERVNNLGGWWSGGDVRRAFAELGRLLGLTAGSPPGIEKEMHQLLRHHCGPEWVGASQALIPALVSALNARTIPDAAQLKSVYESLV